MVKKLFQILYDSLKEIKTYTSEYRFLKSHQVKANAIKAKILTKRVIKLGVFGDKNYKSIYKLLIYNINKANLIATRLVYWSNKGKRFKEIKEHYLNTNKNDSEIVIYFPVKMYEKYDLIPVCSKEHLVYIIKKQFKNISIQLKK